jgi:beta-N-acetylhexosaminidase
MKRRIILTASVIAIGLSLRAFGASVGLPAAIVKYGGSILWATMVYFLVALLTPVRGRLVAATAMAIAICVESFRLVHAPWLDAFRFTLPGALLLGRIFSLWNIVAYAAGVTLAAAIDPGDAAKSRPVSARWIRYSALSAAALILIAVSFNLDDPAFLSARAWAPIALLAASAAGLASSFAAERSAIQSPARLALLALWLSVPAALAGSWFAGRLREERILATPPELGQLYGRHFIIGYDDIGDVEPLVARGLVGGVFVTQRNAAGRGVEELRAEIAHLRNLRREAGLPPLIVAADQEGGLVSRLSPPLPAHPPLSMLASLPSAERRARAWQEGEAMGSELHALGVTLDFAPVVDLRTDRNVGTPDFGSRIDRRAIDADPAIVAEIATAFAQGLDAKGVKATLKHFPGLGRVPEDTHAVRARLAAPATELDTTDWATFRQVLAHAPAAVMASHAIVDAIDPDHPASQSKAAIDSLLRGAWGFDGIVVTDDLIMGAVFRHDICSGVVASLNAGVDLLLVSYDGRQFYRLIDCVLTAERDGKLDRASIAASDARLRARFEPKVQE